MGPFCPPALSGPQVVTTIQQEASGGRDTKARAGHYGVGTGGAGEKMLVVRRSGLEAPACTHACAGHSLPTGPSPSPSLQEIVSLLKKRLRTDNPQKQWLGVQLFQKVWQLGAVVAAAQPCGTPLAAQGLFQAPPRLAPPNQPPDRPTDSLTNRPNRLSGAGRVWQRAGHAPGGAAAGGGPGHGPACQARDRGWQGRPARCQGAAQAVRQGRHHGLPRRAPGGPLAYVSSLLRSACAGARHSPDVHGGTRVHACCMPRPLYATPIGGREAAPSWALGSRRVFADKTRQRRERGERERQGGATVMDLVPQPS